MSNFLTSYFNDVFQPNSWLRTVTVSFGASAGILFTLKYVLSFRRPRCKNLLSLTGKTCIITGANSGIGKAVAFEFARRNARVILACRDAQKANITAVEIRKKVKNANVEVYLLDLASFESIRHCADAIKEKEDGIDILVNNAGLMSCPFQKSVDGIEMQFAVNHLGHFLLTNLLLDKIKEKVDARIIVVASSLYKYATVDLVNFNNETYYNPTQAYGRSKLANILFTQALSKRLPDSITVNSMHPGVVWTELGRYRIPNYIVKLLFTIPAYFLMRSPDQGAQTIIHMATEPSLKGVTGKYFGDCSIESLNSHAEDQHMSEKLWEMSEHLTSSKKDS